MNKFQFDIDKYSELLRAVASLSRLYSNNEKAYIDSRFVEKLFVYTSGAKDLSRKDNSFDALLGNAGVGVKTFGISTANSKKSEKIAEFTTFASQGFFNGLSQEQLAIKASEIRNARVATDAAEYDIDISNSFYHCLLRTNEGAIIHEEPYSYVDVEKIKPIDPNTFDEVDTFPDGIGFPCFSDNKNIYTYNTSKNVLFKRFDIANGKNSELIPLIIHEGVFEKLLGWFKNSNKLNLEYKIQEKLPSYNLVDPTKSDVDFVVLPLYSLSETKRASKENGRTTKIVAEKSGINQWNAGGRKRKFGEAYIPIPIEIHHKYPDFFPSADKPFNLTLPNGKNVVAKVCQQNRKALMSNPNDLICEWLFKSIDSKYSEKEFENRFNSKKFYTYQDLEMAGKDAVKVIKIDSNHFSIEFMALGSFDKFLMGNAEYDLQSDE